MALFKARQVPNGVITNYHRIGYVNLHHDRTLSGILNSYASQEQVTEGNKISSQIFTFKNITKEEEESMGIRQLAYTKLKNTSEWSDSIDC